MSKAYGARCRIEYLTDTRLPAFAERDGLQWRFWPRSNRLMRGSDEFRREWSLTGLAATALAPADVTIINTSGHGGPYTRALAKALLWRGRPYIAMIGGLHATATGQQREYFADACAVAVHNTALRDYLIAGGLPPEKLVVVPLGVDTKRFAPQESRDGTIRQPALLYVGRLIKWKGIDRLLRALAVVRQQHPMVVLNIIGPPSDLEYLTTLHQLVDNLSLNDSVHFQGVISYEALPEHYRSASLLVLPSVGEGFGMVAVESMACGTPVVALRTPGGPLDIITDGEDGRLVEETELAHGISALLSNPSRLFAMGVAARCAVMERYSDGVTAHSFDNLVSRALTHS